MSVYFAQAGRYIKVGYSADPIGRSTTVTRNGRRPADLPRLADTRLLGWIPGGLLREAQIHDAFADRRVDGEWFSIDELEVRDLIWSDPFGVDIQRMSALAVFASIKYPEWTRDEIAAAGIRIEAATEAESIAAMDKWFGGAA